MGAEDRNAPNNFHVILNDDMGTRMFTPWLTEDHANRLRDILTEIEEDRVSRLGGSREDGDGNFYSVVPDDVWSKR